MPIPGEAIGSFTGLGGSTVTTLIWSKSPEQAADALITVAGYLERIGPPLRASAKEARYDVIENFDTETDPSGTPWQELEEEYEAWKMHVAPGETILRLSGRLETAATSEKAFVVDVVEGNIFYNTSGFPPYWAVHQFGSPGYIPGQLSKRNIKKLGLQDVYKDDMGKLVGPGKGTSVPPRPYIGVSGDAEARIFDIFDAWFFFGTNRIRETARGNLQTRESSGRFGPNLKFE